MLINDHWMRFVLLLLVVGAQWVIQIYGKIDDNQLFRCLCRVSFVSISHISCSRAVWVFPVSATECIAAHFSKAICDIGIPSILVFVCVCVCVIRHIIGKFRFDFSVSKFFIIMMTHPKNGNTPLGRTKTRCCYFLSISLTLFRPYSRTIVYIHISFVWQFECMTFWTHSIYAIGIRSPVFRFLFYFVECEFIPLTKTDCNMKLDR